MHRKILRVLTTAVAITGALCLNAVAAQPLLQYDQMELHGAIRKDNTICVPFRTLMEELEYDVQWYNNRAIAEGEHTVIAKPGADFFTINGHAITSPVDVLLKNDRVLIPVRALCEALGLTVRYDTESGTATIVPPVDGILKPTIPTEKPTTPPVDSGRDYTEEELLWLARIVEAEAGGESAEGKLAVANVVLNRVDSPNYPDTIYDVIFDTKYGVQFEPTSNGTVYNNPSQESIDAARQALEGENNIGDALYFYSPALVDAVWIRTNCEFVQTIGCHDFYK